MNNYEICPKCGARAYARSLYSGYYCFPKQGGCGTQFPAQIQEINGIYRFTVTANTYLKRDITAYFHDYYISTRNGGGAFSSLILAIKSHGTESTKKAIAKIIKEDLDKIIDNHDDYCKEQPIVIAVPRSKPDAFWQSQELQFRPAISLGLKNSNHIVQDSDEKWMIDGTQYITRTEATQTTHKALLNDPTNTGPEPYPGITRDTCQLGGDISGKKIILIDDIYTENKGIDEDCIQFLLDNGAVDVILYTLGRTKKSVKESSADATELNVPF